MTTRYPATGIDDASTLPNPSTSNTTNNPSHAGQHANANDAIKAVETKLGTGASTPASNTLLIGTGAGTSSWSALTSAQLAASLSDETGSGSAVFATTPTLITPKIDTIQEATLNNGVTVGGVNLKAGLIPSSAIPVNGVGGSQLATSAITLGYAEITADFATTSTAYTSVTDLSVTVTIPAGGRRVRVSAWAMDGFQSATGGTAMRASIWDGAVGSGTQLTQSAGTATGSFGVPLSMQSIKTPAAGTKTYNIGFKTGTGTGTLEANASYPAFILVELI